MQPFPPLPDWVALEHSVAEILTQQELHGWYFNERSAWELETSLRKELQTLSELLRNRHPFIASAEFTPKRDNRTQGYVKGAKFTRIKELNPTSRDHITWILTTQYGWTPSLTSLKTKKPVIDETVLKDIG